MAEPALRPLSALADLLLCSERTARRRLADAMAADAGLRVVKRGRTILLTPEQIQRIIRALEWRSISASAAKSGTRAAPSASGGKPSRSQSSAQDRLRERMRSLSRRPRQTESAPIALTVLPGGRAE
jgi:hypothetical protein